MILRLKPRKSRPPPDLLKTDQQKTTSAILPHNVFQFQKRFGFWPERFLLFDAANLKLDSRFLSWNSGRSRAQRAPPRPGSDRPVGWPSALLDRPIRYKFDAHFPRGKKIWNAREPIFPARVISQLSSRKMAVFRQFFASIDAIARVNAWALT